MTALLERSADNQVAWRLAATAIFRAGEAMIDAGKPVRATLEEYEDDLSARQRRFLHGPVFGQISEQARDPSGQRFHPKVWKELFRSQFLGSTWEMVDGKPIELRVSTEDLGVKAYSEYIDKVLAEAATTWGVEFRFLSDEREAVRYRPARRREAEGAPA